MLQWDQFLRLFLDFIVVSSPLLIKEKGIFKVDASTPWVQRPQTGGALAFLPKSGKVYVSWSASRSHIAAFYSIQPQEVPTASLN